MEAKQAFDIMGRRGDAIPSSDVETDKMEEMDDKESDLERLSKKRGSEEVENESEDNEKEGVLKRAKRALKGGKAGSEAVDGVSDGGADAGEEEDEESGADGEEESEDEAARKAALEKEEEDNEQEQERQSAVGELKEIEIGFAHLKDKLYETQMKKLEFELKLCEMNKHPDFLYFMKLIDENFNGQIQRSINMQKYKLRCLDNQTRASRVAAHQQWIKQGEDLKYKEIRQITSDWYEINKERRTMDTAELDTPEFYQYNRHINKHNVTSQQSINELVCHRNALYKELSNLQGLVQNRRVLPSALNSLGGCKDDERDGDLRQMGL